MKIDEVASTTKKARVATHTHIKGLGLNEKGAAVAQAAGWVGQESAREASGVVVDMIKEKKNGWKSLVIYGCAGDGEDGVGARDRARIRDESTVLSHGWVRGVFARGEEDGSVDGELSKSDWFAD